MQINESPSKNICKLRSNGGSTHSVPLDPLIGFKGYTCKGGKGKEGGERSPQILFADLRPWICGTNPVKKLVQQNRVETLHHDRQTLQQNGTVKIITTKPCNSPAKTHQFWFVKRTSCLGCDWIKGISRPLTYQTRWLADTIQRL